MPGTRRLVLGPDPDMNDERSYRINSPKPWNYTIGLGGGSNCCFSQTPRLHLLWLSEQLKQATTSEGRKALLKTMARTVLGKNRYEALKSRIRKSA
ncbi:hypothetical protein I6F15_28825 [Bradyrhizobium sp. BRP14]|nr:hypothetical protein [Bradyrhizobium sp. BRP14]